MNRSESLKAAKRIAPYVARTPLIASRALSERTGKKVWLKLETQQPTGAFKVRAAFNGILAHLGEARAKGVLTTSSGNYAQAVAYAAKQLGVKAAIVMTDDTAPLKIEKTRELGGEVIFCGTTFESRFETLGRVQKERGAMVLHGFDSEETIAGNGTIALELLEDLSADFTVFCPASGGGLISGIASVLKDGNTRHQVFGFQPANGGAIVRSLEKGERVNVGKVNTIADALVAAIPGERTFSMMRKHVDGFGAVTEGEIKSTLRILFEDQKIVVEPGGAVGVAGLLFGKHKPTHDNVVCIVSGGNIDIETLYSLIRN